MAKVGFHISLTNVEGERNDDDIVGWFLVREDASMVGMGGNCGVDLGLKWLSAG